MVMISLTILVCFVCFGAQKPYQLVDADGKFTITLAGNAGSYTASVDSSGQMTVEGSDGSKAILTQVRHLR